MNSSVSSTSTNTLPTPAHSVNGSSAQPDMSHDTIMGDDHQQKRKRAAEESVDDREQKKAHIEGGHVIDISDLHVNIGDPYLFRRSLSGKPSKTPRLTEDLFEMFNLTGIATEVARTLPNGAKNALRKTYKGHIKTLGVAGHFDSIKKDEADKNHFCTLINIPDDAWRAHFQAQRDVLDGFSNPAKANLPRAMTMAKGTLEKHQWDASVLGELAPGKLDGKTHSARATAPNTPLHPALSRSANGQGPQSRPQPVHAQSAQEASRPRRTVNKRSYDDSSFEGYAESFGDDDGGGDGYRSTGEADGSGLKRRKKNHGPSQLSGAPIRQQSYGPGMVGN